MAPILEEIVTRAITAEPDVEVVQVRSHGADLAAEVEGSGAALVVVEARTPGLHESLRALLYRCPHVRLLTISGAGRTACLYELRPRRLVLLDVSLRDLRKVVRKASHAASKREGSGRRNGATAAEPASRAGEVGTAERVERESELRGGESS